MSENTDNTNVYANTDAREAIKSHLTSAYAALVDGEAYEEAMNSLDRAEKSDYESIIDAITNLIHTVSINNR